jgi:uncharacterized protein
MAKDVNRLRIVAAGVVLACSLVAAQAQTPAPAPAPGSPEALALDITNMQMRQINLDQITMIALQQVAQAKRITDPKQVADLMSIAPIIKEEVAGILPNMSKMIASFFSDNFSAQELRELQAFYASPTGQKLNARSQEFGARMGVAMQLAMQQRAPVIERRVREEMAKKGHQL